MDFVSLINNFKGVNFCSENGFSVNKNKLKQLKKQIKKTFPKDVDLDVKVGCLDIVDYPVIVVDFYDDDGRCVDETVVVPTYKIKSWRDLLSIGTYFFIKNEKQFDGFKKLLEQGTIYQTILENAEIDIYITVFNSIGLTVKDKANNIVFPI